MTSSFCSMMRTRLQVICAGSSEVGSQEWTRPEERGDREQPRHHSASKSPERHHKATARKLGVITSSIQDARDGLLLYQMGAADIPKPDTTGTNLELCFMHPTASALQAEVLCCVLHSSQSPGMKTPQAVKALSEHKCAFIIKGKDRRA